MKVFFIIVLLLELLFNNVMLYNKKELVQSELQGTMQLQPENKHEDLKVDNQVDKKEDITPIVMENPPFSYYRSSNAVEKQNQPLNLTLKSSRPNEIVDDDNWFRNNNLAMNTYQIPNASMDTTGDLPDGIDTMWDGLIITKAIYDGAYIYCTYGNDYSEGYILNIYERKTCEIKYSFDFSNYRYSPEYIEEDFDYIQQRVEWATIQDNILYIAHGHSTYAYSSNNMNAYITAIDLSDYSILWRTEALVCNSVNFLILDDVIICGYGFTEEADYLCQVDIHTGKVLENIPLKTAATYILDKENVLYVRTYDMDYEFDIVR